MPHRPSGTQNPVDGVFAPRRAADLRLRPVYTTALTRIARVCARARSWALSTHSRRLTVGDDTPELDDMQSSARRRARARVPWWLSRKPRSATFCC